MKKFDLKKLSAAVTMMVSSLFAPSLTQASDIEIYKEAQEGNITLMFMLDVSASMSALAYPKEAGKMNAGAVLACDFLYKTAAERDDIYNTANLGSAVEVGMTGGPEYRRQWCEYNNKKYYDRITKLKDAMFSLLLGNPDLGIARIDDEKVIGLSTLGATDGNKGASSTFEIPLIYETGRVIVPARKLSEKVITENGKLITQRELLVQKMVEMEAYANTPTSRSFAETIAYLMGNTTENKITKKATNVETRWIMIRDGHYWYYDCQIHRTTGYCDLTSSGIKLSSGGSVNSTQLNSLIPANAQAGREVTYYYKHSNGQYVDFAKWYNTPSKEINVIIPSGFKSSVDSSKNIAKTKYESPASLTQTDDKKRCNAQGVYVLTDGDPTSDDDAEILLRKSLGLSEADTRFSCSDSFDCAHNMSKILRDKDNALNPKKIAIKTAVVGFGNSFSTVGSPGVKPYDPTLSEKENLENAKAITNSENVRKAAEWGIYGRGGWYSASSTRDVVESVNKFLENLNTDIPALTTGSPTIPVDSLNRFMILKDAYYSSFSPKPDTTQQLWFGNVSKYYVKDGILVGNSTAQGTLNKKVPIFNADKTLAAAVQDLWGGGSRLALLLKNATNPNTSDRVIYTNRFMSGSSAVGKSNEIQRVNVDTLYDNSKLGNDTGRNYWLNLLGFNIDANATVNKSQLSSYPELRQLGATMHSKPIVLTQEGQSVYTTELNTYETYKDKNDTEIRAALTASGITDATQVTKQLAKIKATIKTVEKKLETRKSYVMYGSTQGLLHIIDTRNGKEKFAFVPHELFESQKEGFLTEKSTKGGKENLYYGIDAPWADFSQYVPTSAGSKVSTVKDATLKTDKDEVDIAGKGLQWIYGGLRMGGRSYYALDVSDIDNPKLKFHINPDGDSSGPLSFMGQSWSKPTLTFVKWKGKSKLVMLVGGGYDTGYESSTYKQSNKKGAGVYMFDAHNGKLLWWASANSATSDAEYTSHSDLQYSVVSQINAIDTDNDGFVDNLYFGDLGGQAFRVDLDNSTQDSKKFAKRVVTLFKAGGTVAPRFYETPSLTVHRDATAGLFMVTAWNSGDRSSPLAGPQHPTNKQTAQDATYVMYDVDVLRNNLLTSNTMNSATATSSFADLNESTGTPVVTNGKYNLGWKYTYPSADGRYKGIDRIYALKDILYANVFDRDGVGVGGECGAGVKGDTLLYEYCLPTGKCTPEQHGRGDDGDPSTPRNQPISGGMNAIDTVGPKGDGKVGLVGSLTEPCPANSTDIRCRAVARTPGIGIIRWYES